MLGGNWTRGYMDSADLPAHAYIQSASATDPIHPACQKRARLYFMLH
jgi:hypothetical protein